VPGGAARRSPPCGPSRAAARATRTYEIEASFYEHLASGLPVALPACYFVAYDAEADDYVVLLEDLAPAVPGNQIAGLTPQDVAAAIGELAALHAAGWDDPVLVALPWLNRHDPDTAALTAAVVADLYAGFRGRYTARLAPATLSLIEDFLPRLGAYPCHRDGPATLVHGDFRADNLLFGTGRPAGKQRRWWRPR
jgi:Ser/Thr protein kinase RdoA (MazF antagonist)